MLGFCEDGFVIPMVALFYNDAATADILESKRRVRLQLADIKQRSQILAQKYRYSIIERLNSFLLYWRDHVGFRISAWRYQPPKAAVDRCLSSPEFEFLKYLHKLTQRMAAWRVFPDKHLPPEQLPKEFVDIKGHMDAPQAVYSRLHRIQEVMDAFIPAEMQRTLCSLMLMTLMRQPEAPNLSNEE
jgi:hypothetical protein